MMKTSISKEEKMLASSSWRRAKAYNSREQQSLQKEKHRLLKQFEAETGQLKAAQNRFELQYKTGRKTSITLPPLREESSARLRLPKRSVERRDSLGSSKSLPSLPSLEDSLSTEAASDTRLRSRSVSSAADFHPAGRVNNHDDVAEKTGFTNRRRTKSHAGFPNT